MAGSASFTIAATGSLSGEATPGEMQGSASFSITATLQVAEVKPRGGDDAPRRGRYQVQVRNKLHLFDTDEEAQAFIASLRKKAKKAAVKTLEPAYVEMMSAITDGFDDEQEIEELLMLL